MSSEFKPTILYVEDDEGIRKQLKKFFTSISSEVYMAEDGLIGLNAFKKYSPDIVISDIKMPNMSGVEMIKAIKKINPKQHAILTTAHSESAYFMDAIEFKIDAYVLKPVNLDILEEKIAEITELIVKKENFKTQPKEELLEIIEEFISGEVYDTDSIVALDKLKKYSSLQTYVDKIYSNSHNVGVLMFSIYNINRSDEMLNAKVSNRILKDVSKILKTKIRSIDILIKYNEQNFVIIAPNTDVSGTQKYADKLNKIIYTKIFAGVAHLKSNFSTTMIDKDDDIRDIFNRLEESLKKIEKDTLEYLIQIKGDSYGTRD